VKKTGKRSMGINQMMQDEQTSPNGVAMPSNPIRYAGQKDSFCFKG